MESPQQACAELVDVNEGWVDRRVFWDRAIYERELDRIFARCWLFVAHASQVAEPGQFVTSYMGEDSVIVARATSGIHVFLNSCTHRGNRVCFADAGRRRQFVCNYHGWSFGRDGGLLGVPEEALYRRNPRFDKARLGLRQARVETYKGLVFATFSEEAPPLAEYLGDFRWYLDVMLDNDEGGTEFLDGGAHCTLRCNWKLPAENFAGDAYHAPWTHDAGAKAMFNRGVTVPDEPSYHVNVNGHGWEFTLGDHINAGALAEPAVIEYLRERGAAMEARLGTLRARMVAALSSVTVFPNFSFLPGIATFRTWLPKGPHATELRTFVLVNRNAPEKVKEAYRRGVMMTFSPSGVFEGDDGENWEHATAANAGHVTRRQRLYYGLGGLGEPIDHPELPGRVYEGAFNDANQLAFYQRWADLLDADTWQAVPRR